MTEGFWGKLAAALKAALGAASRRSEVIEQTLDQGYPRLLRLFTGLWSRLVQRLGSAPDSGGVEASFEKLLRMRWVTPR